MHNNVAYRTARALRKQGSAVLRFNFRGVGASTGTHGEGVAEQEDVRAALDFMAARHPALPLWIAGFSFGARVGLAVGAQDVRVSRLLGIGLVPRLFDFSFLLPCKKPTALIHGANDELAEAASVRAIFEGMTARKLFTEVAGATHLFPGKLDELDRALGESIKFLDSPAGGGL